MGKGVMEVAGGGVASMVGHERDRDREVALYEDGCPPPFGLGVVSSGVRSDSWGTDGVEFGNGRIGGVLEDEGIGLRLMSEGVAVNLGWGEGDGVHLLGMAPWGGGLDRVDSL